MILQITLDTDKPKDNATLGLLLRANLTAQSPAAEKPASPVEQVAADKPSEPVAVEDSVETDLDGAEWDPTIHSSTKSKTQDGRWKKRRGAAKQEKVAETPGTATEKEYTLKDFTTSLKTHRGKWGIDRTKAVLDEATGKSHPSEITQNMFRAAIEALDNDDGGQSDAIDLSDF